MAEIMIFTWLGSLIVVFALSRKSERGAPPSLRVQADPFEVEVVESLRKTLAGVRFVPPTVTVRGRCDLRGLDGAVLVEVEIKAFSKPGPEIERKIDGGRA